MMQIPRYHPALFVNRSGETQNVVHVVRRLLRGDSVRNRTITFVGEYGLGKSWLLTHIHDHLLDKFSEQEKKRIDLFLIDLNQYKHDNPVTAVMAILRHAGKELFQEETPGITPAEMSRALVHRLREWLGKGRVLVVFVDGIFDASWDFLNELEEYVLGPLAIEPRVLLVLDSRGKGYPWKTPELRVQVESKELQGFDESDTEKQVQRIWEETMNRPPPASLNLKHLHQLTRGYPLANSLFAVAVAEAGRADPEEALDTVIRELLESMIDDQSRYQEFREILEALCVLRAFDEDRIPQLLAAYYRARGDEERAREREQWDYKQTRRVRRDLVRQALASWDEKKGGFVISSYLRHLLETFLKQEHPRVWRALHQRALELYEEWARKYPKTASRWKKEAKYHAEKLQEGA